MTNQSLNQKKGTARRLFSLSLLAASLLPLASYAASSEKMVIADRAEININVTSAQPYESSHTNLTQKTTQNGETIWVIHQPQASFVKIHFAQLTLPDGMAIELLNPDTNEKLHYGASLNTPKTQDTARGDDGVERFSAMSIAGDTVEIRLVGQANNQQTAPSVVIDFVQFGKPQAELDTLMQNNTQMDSDGYITESICGTDQKRAVACFADSYPTEVKHADPVARLLINGRSLCTAWRVGPDNLMMTNNHCIESAAEAASTEVWFNYQLAACGGSRETTVKVQADQLLKTNITLDYTLFNVKNFSQIAAFGALGLDVRTPVAKERIFIPQHPGGRHKELGITTDQTGTSLCQIDSPVTNGKGYNTDTGYLCDTEGGSSGSPVLAASSNKVIALHHLGGCENRGVLIDKIWPQISSFFPAGIPDGSIGSGGGSTNLSPIADFTYRCNATQCDFDASSSYDNDGTITAYSWQFGNGSTASGLNASHIYVTEGSYNVTLTVTDNEGASRSQTQSITVSTGNAGSCNATAWNSSAVYLKGDQVSYTGHLYEAKWWTQGDNPLDNSSEWAVWIDKGVCQ
ncbi:PKD domain-containing protein [Thaumasiovibrio subtropicus]|uniref:PKD domain-containing protein n=1 Tax=Thaumasiovibrio subtropicus TaxID=1891207 RepID=UPI000B34E2BA|nr:PKD domain-containing protein [Thaumasiovibrio subtropicus]